MRSHLIKDLVSKDPGLVIALAKLFEKQLYLLTEISELVLQKIVLFMRLLE